MGQNNGETRCISTTLLLYLHLSLERPKFPTEPAHRYGGRGGRKRRSSPLQYRRVFRLVPPTRISGDVNCVWDELISCHLRALHYIYAYDAPRITAWRWASLRNMRITLFGSKARMITVAALRHSGQKTK